MRFSEGLKELAVAGLLTQHKAARALYIELFPPALLLSLLGKVFGPLLLLRLPVRPLPLVLEPVGFKIILGHCVVNVYG